MSDTIVSSLLSDTKRSLIEVYLELQKHYESIYGKDTVVIMEVGSFFEIYGVDNAEEQIGKPKEIGDLLNLQLTRKNKNIPENNTKNPLLVGFPTATFDRYIRRIIAEKKYTIIIIRQRGTPPAIERYLDRILSPGVHADYALDHRANFVSSLVIEMEDDRYMAGFGALDVSTGSSYIAEMYSTKEDPTFALDELFRHLQAYPTSELILTIGSQSIDPDDIRDYLSLGDHIHVLEKTKRLSIAYQNELFSSIYSITSFLSPIEFLDLERKRFASEAMAALIEFVISHDHDVIQKLQKPHIIESDTFVYLGNNPLEQLDIIHRDPSKETVLSLMDKTVTAIGRRLLFDRINNPIRDKATLEARYDLIDAILPCYTEVESAMRNVYDLERIVRRIRTERLHPLEINFIYDSCVSAKSILSCLPEDTTKLSEHKDAIDHLITTVESTINLDESTKVLQTDIKQSFFLSGVDPELDKLAQDIDSESTKLELIRSVITDLLTEKVGSSGADDYVSVRQLEKEGHYIFLTKNRFAMIESVLKKQFISIDGVVHAFDDFTYKLQKTTVKITGPIIDTISERITILESRLTARVRERFLSFVKVLDTDHVNTIIEMSSALAAIDVALSCAKSNIAYALTRPNIVESDTPLLSIEELRHPLVEAREQNGIYVPNDIQLGGEENQGIWSAKTRGVLLYGINSSGKSSLMKSIGIAVVLAQSGCYVPARSMRFTLVRELFTRIVSQDNIAKGLSSFAVEMMELKNIFNRASNQSLILGDEISHGTETLSAIAIIAAALKELHDVGSFFFFTTHLHQLQSLPYLADMPQVQSLHLAVHYDDTTDTLVFDRTLKEGSGSSIYGLEFAQSLHMKDAFLKQAMKIRRELAGELGSAELLIKQQTSKYNDTVYFTRCAVCGDNVEDTHHIKEQHTADEHGRIDHFHKDHKYNLIQLCKACHTKVHQGKLEIHGFIRTSKGFALDVKEVE